MDDLHICGRDVTIDGVGGVLGSAGPVYIRTGGEKITTITGVMQFDILDIPWLVAQGTWEDVILHEMGHVIGIGTLWGYIGLVDGALNYLGANAINIWNSWGCVGTPPVETDGGPGTAGGHWDEDCLINEFMTGFINAPPNPISTLTIASVEDIGYEVNYATADEYNGGDTTCCASGSPALAPETTNKPELSDAGRAEAIAYGKQLLSQNQRPPPAEGTEGGHDENGPVYVGDRFVVILYMERENIYDVFVNNK